MKLKLTIKTLLFLFMGYSITSCLDGDQMNTPPEGSSAILLMTYNANRANQVNSGLQFFGNQALLYPPSDEVDTAIFAVSLQGVERFNKDISLTLVTNSIDALNDNYFSDSLDYVMMPESNYEIINTTAVIKAGETYAEFKVKFFPSKIDFTKNLMLPVTAVNSVDLPMSTNFGYVYFHIVGNPIAGAYNWDFTRCSDPACAGGPDGNSFTGDNSILAPVNGTTVRVPTGYYDGADYIITFDDDGAGNLTNFKAVVDPVKVNGDWATAGISIVTGPTILVENNNTKFTLNYTTATRNVTDVYYK